MDGYFRSTVRGIGWTGATRVFLRAIGFLKLIALAHFEVLTKAQFGVYGIATLVLAFLELLTEAGINVFLIQEKEEVNKYINTAWVISVIRGVIISALILVSTPLVVAFFKSPSTYQLLILVAFVPLIRGFINPSVVKFQKELVFNKDFFYKSAIYLTEFVFSLSLAIITRSPVALIIGLLISAVVEVIMSFLLVGPRPRFAFDKKQARTILHRGKWVTGFGIFDYFFTQGDNIAVGRILGEASLGVYDIAYTISMTPITEIVGVFYQVTFPVYVKIIKDKGRLLRAFWRTFSVSSILVIGLSLGIFVFAKQIVYTFLNPTWVDAIPAIQMLSFVGMVRGLTMSVNSLFMALQKQRYVTVITFVNMLGLFVTIIPLVSRYGLVGAAVSALAGTIIAIPVELYYFMKVTRELRND